MVEIQRFISILQELHEFGLLLVVCLEYLDTSAMSFSTSVV